MFGNLINGHDLLFLLHKLRQGQARRVAARLLGGRRRRVEMSWAKTEVPPTNWWDIPEVRQRWNRLISGDGDVDFCQHVARTHLAGRRDLLALSLGCGTGVCEERWAGLGSFARIDAYDLVPERIDYARRSAAAKGLEGLLHYRVGDVYEVDWPTQTYDVVIAEGSLHHFTPLRQILCKVDAVLKADGYLLVNEFVGPTRFQWTDRQLEAINGLLAVLPTRYRQLWRSAQTKSPVVRPSRLFVRFGDPSEAVESAAILPLLDELFDVLEVRAYGGTILHMLFHAIAHNFVAQDEVTRTFLRLCIDAEDALLASGDLQTDFAAVVCRRKGGPRTPAAAGAAGPQPQPRPAP